MKKNKNAFPLFQAADLFWEAGRLMTGSSEVVMQRLNLMSKPFDGRSSVPYAEMTRMWHEKFAAGLSFYMRLGYAPWAMLPALFKNRANPDVFGALADHHLDMAAGALKPLRRSVRANSRRMKKKR